MAEQTVMWRGAVGGAGIVCQERLILLLFGVAPIQHRNIEFRLLWQRQFTGKRDRAGCEARVCWLRRRRSQPLQSAGVALVIENLPAATVTGIRAIGLLRCIVEERE